MRVKQRQTIIRTDSDQIGSILLIIILGASLFLLGCSHKDPSYLNVNDTKSRGFNLSNQTLWKPLLATGPYSYRDSDFKKSNLTSKAHLPSSNSFSEKSFCYTWNQLSRGYVSKYAVPPPKASRVYALLSIAQHDAWLMTKREIWDRHVNLSPEQQIVFSKMAITSASATILNYLFLSETRRIDSVLVEQDAFLLKMYPNDSTVLQWGQKLGSSVAEEIIAKRYHDGSSGHWVGEIPVGEGFWLDKTKRGESGVLAFWGSVTPMRAYHKDSAQFLLGPPPDFYGPEYAQALEEVRQISLDRSQAQLRSALYWADKLWTPTPPGRWNALACSLLTVRNTDEGDAVRILALMNLSMFDAGIWCWAAKYRYWLIRPSQADQTITSPLELPDFPSFPSGHASFSGAASGVLGHIIPELRVQMDSLAREAAMSRLYAGIHYRFDNDSGLVLGKRIAERALEEEIELKEIKNAAK